ncbi:LolA family protein [Halomonas lysinitropha]|uniref:Outer membrane lipoprotein carrier protein LolA n=1 Tax=Halomonas lysinitropha TaxID=2607506 RepID=A0A5K1I2E5_9GAMM|nr:LolA-related protein [Halomonas lysinitropha]VVZ94153.1 hypothetical protein HALO32_00203 [Halomonas lysinitropha]
MRQILGIASLGLLLSTSPSLWASPQPDALAERLADHSTQCASFKQSRWLADLEVRLDSRGHFRRQDNALVWQTTAPVEDRLDLSEESDDLPIDFQVLLPVFNGLLSGDWQALEHHFTIELRGELDEWRADLTPIDSALGEHLSQLVVHGGERVEQLAIAFRDGDRLELTLTPVDCEGLDEGNAAQ